MSQNPLQSYFRKPAVFITLPSGGKFYPPNSLEQTESGEIPVFPMTAIDEIHYRTPDALYNGTATVEVIQSCLPNIKDPWAMPGIDFDTVLIGIRIASYGNTMETSSVCPHCGNENTFDVDLRYVLGGIESADFSKPLVVDDKLSMFFRPLSYKEIVSNQLKQFADQRELEMVTRQAADATNTEVSDKVREILKHLATMTATSIANSIAYIVLDGAKIEQREFIEEFIVNADKSLYKKIRDFLLDIKEKTEIKPLTITCQNTECLKKYETPFTMDVAHFFA